MDYKILNVHGLRSLVSHVMQFPVSTFLYFYCCHL